MSKKKMKLLIDKLDICNTTLNQFGTMSEKLAPYRATWKARFIYPVHQIRDHAASLHRALGLSWNTNCPCQSPHIARLQLEPRMVDAKARDKRAMSKTDTIHFRILVSVKPLERSRLSTPRKHSWQETQVQIVEKISGDCDKENLKPTSPKRIPKVTIIAPEPPQDSRSKNNIDPKTLFKIDDICRSIDHAQQGKRTLSLCLDGQGTFHGTYAIEKAAPQELSDTITLAELLASSPGKRNSQKALSGRDRRLLAVNLTSSLLQLHATPWLDTFWSKKDISFLCPDTTTLAINSAQPYVSQTFLTKPPHNTAPQPTPSTTATTVKSKALHGNPSILALGILLLELYFGETLENAWDVSPIVFDYDSTGAELLCAALGWVENVKDDISFKYLQAAQHCIKCFFDTRSRSLMDEEFRQAVCEKVLVPLQEELALFIEGPL